jgi:hypothetical protein
VADQPLVPLHLRSDADLVAALRALDREVAWPSPVPAGAEPDIASLVRARLEGQRTTTDPRIRDAGRSWRRWSWSPARRALIVAIIALLALAAIAGAAGLGLPGLRIIFGEPSATPSGPSATAGSSPAAGSVVPSRSPGSSRTPVPGPPGSGLGLGELVGLDALDGRAGFAVRKPADPSIGPPDAAWVAPDLNDQVSLVWASSDRVPATHEPGVGLVLTAFRGAVPDGWFAKTIGPGTTVQLVIVDGHRGYWITGDPHLFFYEGPSGFVDDTRRWVGDVLMWAEGPITYRLETSLGREAAIAIAESMD